MDKGTKWKFALLAWLQVLAVAAIAGAVVCLLYRYVEYGEQFARETGTSPFAESAQEADGEKSVQEPEEEGGERAQKLNEGEGNPPLPAVVRVCILDDDFSGQYHAALSFTCDREFTVTSDGELLRKTREFSVSAADLEEGTTLQLAPEEEAAITVDSLTRADGCPQYGGKLRLYRDAGGLVLINEIPLEEYLCGVVSSEMPSDYPMEAQKAQAVCARTYACSRIRKAAGTDALSDLDDSVNCQVYNNYRATETSRQAVTSTRGETLPLEEIQYYSTSCLSERREDLDSDNAFREFLSQEPDADAEYRSPWLRWEAEIQTEDILAKLSEEYGWLADHMDAVRVAKRGGNGQVEELEVRCGKRKKTIEGEYCVRQIFSPERTELLLRDGETHSGMKLLPSAFFWLEEERRDSAVCAVRIHGGGYGHGIGMSQCGAASLAKEGLDYREILEYYYQ